MVSRPLVVLVAPPLVGDYLLVVTIWEGMALVEMLLVGTALGVVLQEAD